MHVWRVATANVALTKITRGDDGSTGILITRYVGGAGDRVHLHNALCNDKLPVYRENLS